jgi:hypothetical protein
MSFSALVDSPIFPVMLSSAKSSDWRFTLHFLPTVVRPLDVVRRVGIIGLEMARLVEHVEETIEANGRTPVGVEVLIAISST